MIMSNNNKIIATTVGFLFDNGAKRHNNNTTQTNFKMEATRTGDKEQNNGTGG